MISILLVRNKSFVDWLYWFCLFWYWSFILCFVFIFGVFSILVVMKFGVVFVIVLFLGICNVILCGCVIRIFFFLLICECSIWEVVYIDFFVFVGVIRIFIWLFCGLIRFWISLFIGVFRILKFLVIFLLGLYFFGCGELILVFNFFRLIFFSECFLKLLVIGIG